MPRRSGWRWSVGDDYLPVRHDSFDHARRILDAVADPLVYYQVDASFHVPVGGWQTWPWAYDWLMVCLGQWLSGVQDPMTVLMVILLLASTINVALSFLHMLMASLLSGGWTGTLSGQDLLYWLGRRVASRRTDTRRFTACRRPSCWFMVSG